MIEMIRKLRNADPASVRHVRSRRGALVTALHDTFFMFFLTLTRNALGQTFRRLHLRIQIRFPLNRWMMPGGLFHIPGCQSIKLFLGNKFQTAKASALKLFFRSELAYITKPVWSREDLFLAYIRARALRRPSPRKDSALWQCARRSKSSISVSYPSPTHITGNREWHLQSLNHTPSRTLSFSFRSPRKFKTWISRCAERRLDDAIPISSCSGFIESIRDVEINHQPDSRVTRAGVTRGTGMEAHKPWQQGRNSLQTPIESAMFRKRLCFSCRS
jgi:hypothetical protein